MNSNENALRMRKNGNENEKKILFFFAWLPDIVSVKGAKGLPYNPELETGVSCLLEKKKFYCSSFMTQVKQVELGMPSCVNLQLLL